MKNIGIVVAVENEFKSLTNLKEKPLKKYKKGPFLVYKYAFKDKFVYIALSSIGQANAASCTQYLITKYKVDFIFNFGSCGALLPSLNLSDVVFVDKILDYGFDTSLIDNCKEHAHIELGYKEPIMEVKNEFKNKIYSEFPNILKVTCSSSNLFIGDPTIKQNISQMYGASICEMESSAIFLTCIKNHVPCFFVKAVSDTVKGGADEYNKFVKDAADKALTILEKILNTNL